MVQIGNPGRERIVCWTLLALALLVLLQAAVSVHRQIGQPYPGFGVMDNLLVAVGGIETGPLRPFDVVRAMNGQVVTSGQQIQDEVRRQPPGTVFHYIVLRGRSLVEADIASEVRTAQDFHRFMVEGFFSALLFLLLGAGVLYLKPGGPDTRLFLAFCLIWLCITALYRDAHCTYRFSPLFLVAFAFSPATYIHLAMTFPQRRAIAARYPRLAWLPYTVSALFAVPLLGWLPLSPDWLVLVPTVSLLYWGGALLVLIVSLLRTSLRGATPLVRQRARVLMTGFAAGQLVPVLATASEATFHVKVPYLNALWRLNFLFPLAVSYAMVRYNLFDLRAVIRMGTIYGAVTGLMLAAYAGAIAVVSVLFTSLDVASSRMIPAAVVALAVVLFLNPVYLRIQSVVDRLFFRQRLDIQRSVERLADSMTTVLDLTRIVRLIARTVDESFHPSRHALLLLDEAARSYRALAQNGRGPEVLADSSLPHCLARQRTPLTRERHEEDPELADCRAGCVPQMVGLGADLVVPVLFQDRISAFFALGPKRSGAAYTTEDLRLLRFVANQSAVALENAKAYSALETANADLRDAIRRVELLESIRASLVKFVPATVQRLIEEAPEAPVFDKREADVSVLFVDIAGYTRLSARLDPERVNRLVERYFGAFLDEILHHGGDVNETVGDGLMVIFQDPDPACHAGAAVRTALGILERSRQIGQEMAGDIEPIVLHVGVNSGVAAVGATKIEGTVGARWTYTASGQVTNVAARLAALGQGDTVIIGPETRSRLAGDFQCEDMGEHRLKNVDGTVRVYQLATVSP
jgi:class 3 adenylate cyclase